MLIKNATAEVHSARRRHQRDLAERSRIRKLVGEIDQIIEACEETHLQGIKECPPDLKERARETLGRAGRVVARAGDADFAGAYYVKPNFVGRGAHVANAGYFVPARHRGEGIGRELVEHSLEEAKRLGFDAMQFNLVFESNPARALYERLGFAAIGRIPAAIEGEDAIIYWRPL